MVEDTNVIHSTNNGDDLTAQKLRRVSICMGCGQEIYDQFILRVSPDLEWHSACLKCADCNQYLDESCTCFVRDGKTYCKNDYVKLFGAKCASCNQNFHKNDYVMRARHKIYHIRCFHCVACTRMLRPGDEFALRDEQLYCKADHQVIEQNLDSTPTLDFGSIISVPNPSGHMAENCQVAVSGQSPLTPLGNGHMRSDSSLSIIPGGLPPSCSSGGAGEGVVEVGRREGKEKKKDKTKTTRIRTVLNEKQLHTLRTCYGANPRPDALMKEQLVEMTGLSPRVIRVWFQNKRCKDKKKQIFMKQMQQQQEKTQALNGVRLQGIGPLIAGSPTRHDGMPMVQPLEVQQFQQNPAVWGPLGPDPSLESQTPFQQLMQGFGEAGDVGGYVPHGLPNPYAHHAPPSMESEMDSFSPQMAPSELSSPSCSE